MTYAPIVRNQYTLDDDYVRESSASLRQHELGTLFERGYFRRYQEDTYRPVVTLTYMLDHQIPGRPEIVGHVQNIVWHAGTAVMVGELAASLLPVASAPAALGAVAAGVVFAVHPGTTEAAVSIGFREDMVATALCVAALLLGLRRTRTGRALALTSYALALFAKENAAVLPGLLVLMRLVCPRVGLRSRRAIFTEAIPFVAITLAFLYVRFGPMASAGSYADPIGGSYAATLVAVPRIFAHYLRLLVVPWPLQTSYENVFDFGVPFATQLPWLLLDLAYIAVAVWLARRREVTGFGLLWYLVALTPMLHFVPVRFAAADRFVYMPLVGGALAAGGLVAHLDRVTQGRRRQWRRPTLAVVGVTMVLTLAVLTRARIDTWRSNLAVWKDALARNPRASMARYRAFAYYLSKGNRQRAAVELETALADCPRKTDFGRRHFCSAFANQLGVLRLDDGDLDGAHAAFTQSAADNPSYVAPLVGNALVALQKGDVETARVYYNIGHMLNPLDPDIVAGMNNVKKKLDEADAAAGTPPELQLK